MTLALQDIQRISDTRATRWHVTGIRDWSALEWAAAMAGEAGEACNAAKKLKRIEGGIQNRDGRLTYEDDASITNYHRLIAEECADTILYAMLLMSRVGADAEETVRRIFNEKSEEYGFPERL